MDHVLEAPRAANDLYRARGDEVQSCRPYLTGDVFAGVKTMSADGTTKARDVLIIQHPCALRTNGVDLVPQLLVAKIQSFRLLTPEDWKGSGKMMPLPFLYPEASTDRKRHFAGMFDTLFLVTPDQLGTCRVACMSQAGINLLLQRWVYHSSRATIPTVTYDEANISVFEEADLIEDWCMERVDRGLKVTDATAECIAWLREEQDGQPMRQELLRDPQQRSTVRQQMKRHLRTLREAKHSATQGD